VIAPSGELDRPKLGSIVFSNPSKRALLNAITHPFIQCTMLFRLFKHIAVEGHRRVVMDIPLLFESKVFIPLCSKIVVVATSEETQLRRLMLRNALSEEDARKRMGSQIPLAEKRRRADFVIENDGSLDELDVRVEQFLSSLNPPTASKSQ